MLSTVLDRNKVLDIAEGSMDSGAATQIYEKNETPAQRFHFVAASGQNEGYYSIENVKSGKVLDVTNGKTADGTVVQQYEKNGSGAQLWRFMYAGDESIFIESKLQDDLVLDVRWGNTFNGTQLQVYSLNGSDAQRFIINPIVPSLDDGLYTIGNAAVATVVDIEGGSYSDGANVQMYEGNGTEAQVFAFVYDENSGYYTIRTGASGKVLDVMGASSLSGANVQQYEGNGTLAQKWAIEPVAGETNSYRIRSACSGLALDVSGANPTNGTNVQMWTTNETAAQTWTLRPPKSDLSEGLYTLTSSLNQKYVLDIAGGSKDDHANVQLYESNNTWAQKFTIEVRSDGYCVFHSLKSGKVLDVVGAGKDGGTNVQQYEYNGSDAQLWEPLYYGGSTYGFRSKCNGLSLDVKGASTQNGANVQVWANNGTAAQRFVLNPTDKTTSLTEGAYVVKSALDDRVLDITSASSNNGARLQLWENNGTFAQKFKILAANSQQYYCVNVHSSKYLDVDTGTRTILQQWDRGASQNQKWDFTPVDDEENAYYIRSPYTGGYLTNIGDGALALRPYTGTTEQTFVLSSTIAFKVYLDAGHGYNSNGDGTIDPGAVGLGCKECDLTSDLVERIGKDLDARGIEYCVGYGVAYWNRQQDAVNKGCSTFLSIHFNACNGYASGTESYVHSYNAAPGSATYQNIIHPYLIAGAGLYDRGKKNDEFAVCGGRLPSVLCEVAFIDNISDMQIYRGREDTVAQFLAAGLEEASRNSACGWY